MVAEWSNSCQVLYGIRQVPGLNPSRDYDIDCSESEMACHYSNSRVPGGSCTAYDNNLILIIQHVL